MSWEGLVIVAKVMAISTMLAWFCGIFDSQSTVAQPRQYNSNLVNQANIPEIVQAPEPEINYSPRNTSPAIEKNVGRERTVLTSSVKDMIAPIGWGMATVCLCGDTPFIVYYQRTEELIIDEAGLRPDRIRVKYKLVDESTPPGLNGWKVSPPTIEISYIDHLFKVEGMNRVNEKIRRVSSDNRLYRVALRNSPRTRCVIFEDIFRGLERIETSSSGQNE